MPANDPPGLDPGAVGAHDLDLEKQFARRGFKAGKKKPGITQSEEQAAKESDALECQGGPHLARRHTLPKEGKGSEKNQRPNTVVQQAEHVADDAIDQFCTKTGPKPRVGQMTGLDHALAHSLEKFIAMRRADPFALVLDHFTLRKAFSADCAYLRILAPRRRVGALRRYPAGGGMRLPVCHSFPPDQCLRLDRATARQLLKLARRNRSMSLPVDYIKPLHTGHPMLSKIIPPRQGNTLPPRSWQMQTTVHFGPATMSAFTRLLVLCPLLFLFALAGCARRATPVEDGIRTKTLLLGNGAEPQDLDPQTCTLYTDMNVLVSLFEGLTAI